MIVLTDFVALCAVALSALVAGRALRQWWRALRAPSAACGGCTGCSRSSGLQTRTDGESSRC